MANITVSVCWKDLPEYKPDANPKNPYVDFISGSTYTNDVISIGQSGSITFQPTVNCPYAHVEKFTIKVTPDTTGLVKVRPGGDGRLVVVDATYKSGVSTKLNMELIRYGETKGYVIDGGKPVIRNEPRRLVAGDVVVILIAVLGAAVVAYYGYRWLKQRRNISD